MTWPSNPATRPDDGRVLRGKARRQARLDAARCLREADIIGGTYVRPGRERTDYEREWNRIIRLLASGRAPR